MCFGRVSVWLEEQQRAIDAAVSDPELGDLLAKARSGCADAKSALSAGTGYLIYEFGFEWVERGRRRYLDEIIGRLWRAHQIAINRLMANDDSDVVGYIRDILVHAPKRQFREESSDISPPASTNSTRKKKGQEPYVKLTRVGGCVTDASYPNESDDGEAQGFPVSPNFQGPTTTQDGKRIRIPSKFRGYQEGVEMIDLLDEFSAQQQSVIPLLMEDVPLSQIADEQSISLYGARKLKTQVWAQYGAINGVVSEIVEPAAEQPHPETVTCERATRIGEEHANGLELTLSV